MLRRSGEVRPGMLHSFRFRLLGLNRQTAAVDIQKAPQRGKSKVLATLLLKVQRAECGLMRSSSISFESPADRGEVGTPMRNATLTMKLKTVDFG